MIPYNKLTGLPMSQETFITFCKINYNKLTGLPIALETFVLFSKIRDYQ